MHSHALSDGELDVTIYVPCFNEERSVVSTLDTIGCAMRELNLRYEVLVYDDGSTDRTAEVVRQYIDEHPAEQNITLIQREGTTELV